MINGPQIDSLKEAIIKTGEYYNIPLESTIIEKILIKNIKDDVFDLYQIHQLLSLINIECGTLFHMKVTKCTGQKLRTLLKDYPIIIENNRNQTKTYSICTRMEGPFQVKLYDYYIKWDTRTVSEVWDDNKYLIIMRYG